MPLPLFGIAQQEKEQPPLPSLPSTILNPLRAPWSSQIYSFFLTYSPSVIFLYFLHWSVMHRMFRMYFDCLISIFIISEHQVKEYKCLFSRVGNAGVWVQWLLGDRAHAKSVNHSIWKMNGMFWSSLPFVSGEWPVQRRAQQAGAEVCADVDGYRGIMKRQPGAHSCSVRPCPPCCERASCRTWLLAGSLSEPSEGPAVRFH